MSENADGRSSLAKAGLMAAVAAAGAGLGLLFTTKPKRLLDLPSGAGDLVGDVKRRVGSRGDSAPDEQGGAPKTNSKDDDYAARRRERRQRRERRRGKST